MAGAATATAESKQEKKTLRANTGISIRSVALTRQEILSFIQSVIQMYYVHRALTGFLLLAMAAASWWSIRLARADMAFRRGTPSEVARAIELVPQSGEYLATLALQAEYSGQDSTPLLEEIARLNPRASAPRIKLGLAAELRGDPAAAERWLQEAFSVDRQFETRWTLANFYFRQGRPGEFWTWMKSALEMSYGGRGAAFDLCWQMTSDPNQILERAIPDRREVAAAYLVYVLNRHRQAAIAGAADRLAKLRTADDLPLLYAASDALLDAGQVRAAADLWQALGNPRPDGITHPGFDEPRIGHGFDWIYADISGVTQLALDTPASHRIRFSGQQPESCELLRQVLGGLRAGAAYTLRWETRTQGMDSPTGLEWRIASRTGEVAASDDWSAGSMAFTPDSDHAVLVLTYRRPEGQVRTEGQMDLRRVTSSAITSSPE
jgi:tetratricopeptide (TPR) repeat protein